MSRDTAGVGVVPLLGAHVEAADISGMPAPCLRLGSGDKAGVRRTVVSSSVSKQRAPVSMHSGSNSELPSSSLDCLRSLKLPPDGFCTYKLRGRTGSKAMVPAETPFRPVAPSVRLRVSVFGEPKHSSAGSQQDCVPAVPGRSWGVLGLRVLGETGESCGELAGRQGGLGGVLGRSSGRLAAARGEPSRTGAPVRLPGLDLLKVDVA